MLYDVLVVGGGPAGITAAIYAQRAGRSVAILEKYIPGGQLNVISEIENYTGFDKIDGITLASKFAQHAKSLGVPIIMEEVIDFDFEGDIKKVICKKNTYEAISIVLAMGSHPRELKIEGEDQLKGRGVSYCAICDGNFFRGKDVAVVGSGDSAFSDALYLSQICNKVYILTKSTLKLHNYSEEEFKSMANVKILKGASSQSILGGEKVEKLVYFKDEKEDEIDVDAVFVAIGRTPETHMLEGKLELTDRGFIKSNAHMNTSQEGVFVCGDVRDGAVKQVAVAVGDGAIAGNEASKYVVNIKKRG